MNLKDLFSVYNLTDLLNAELSQIVLIRHTAAELKDYIWDDDVFNMYQSYQKKEN